MRKASTLHGEGMGCFLAEGKSGVPFHVSGADVESLAFVKHFNARQFRLPGAGGCFACQVKCLGDGIESGFSEGKGSSGARTQFQFQHERRVGTRTVFWSTRQKYHGGNSAGLSCQNIYKLLLGGDDGLPVERGERGAHFKVNGAHGIRGIGEGGAPGNRV